MKEIILLKDGELALKGLNRNSFEDILLKNIKYRLRTCGKFRMVRGQSTVTLIPDEGADVTAACDELSRVFGIAAYSRCAVAPKDLGAILELAPVYLADTLRRAKTFKVEAKRSDKRFPYTSLLAEEKVHDLLTKVARYSGRIRLHTVPFTEIQAAIRDTCPEDYATVVMRRFMMRVASRLAAQNDCHALITGESVAQVASQTMWAIGCTDAVAEFPVFRPCVGLDKEEIITVARKIETFDISVRPFEDCCTVFTPKHPRTRPHLDEMPAAEKGLDINALCERAVAGVKLLTISAGGVKDD